jgi:uncharacterized protein YbbK (DUF523 family)
VPVCPEVEFGLGMPHEPMRLVGLTETLRFLTVRPKQDLTARLVSWAEKRDEKLALENLDGFIFKAKSPSSGMSRGKVYYK